MFGFTKEEAEGQPATILFTPEDRANGEPQKEIETAAREGKAPDVRWHMCKTGERVFIEGQVVPLRGSGNGITGFLKIGQDVTERRQAEAALSDSEERFRQFGEASSDLLWIRDAETLAFEYLSPAFERLYGVPREQVLERNNVQAWLDLIHPDDRESAVTALRSLRNGIPINDEFRMIGHDEIRWVQNTDFPLRDETGKVVRIAGIAQDITERKRAIEMQATLLAELQHRVRNTLAVVRSIARRTAETSGTADEMLAHFQGRLDAFSRVQAALTRNASGSVDLHSLVDDELVAHAAREGQLIKVEGPPLCLEAKTAERMSLAIHELVTNAVKHGALATPEGRIAVDWKVDNSGDRPRLLFNWAESGVSLDPDAAPTDGFGTELLLRSLPYDLGAETNLELRRDGIRFEFAMPLPGEA